MTRSNKLTETELFSKTNVLLLEKNKKNLNTLKGRASLLTNTKVDNSGLIRGMIEFFNDNPDELTKVIPYVSKSMGFQVLEEVKSMLDSGIPIEDIIEKTGVAESKLKIYK